jgi:hypothetical protein
MLVIIRAGLFQPFVAAFVAAFVVAFVPKSN